MRKFLSVFFILILGLALVGLAIWYLFFYNREQSPQDEQNDDLSFIDNFFPIETFDQLNPEGGQVVFEGENQTVPILRQISETPVAGHTVYSKKIKRVEKQTDDEGIEIDVEIEEEINVFRYVERSNGHIYEANSISPQKQRISNTTIPKISEAIFWSNQDNLILRYIDGNGDIKTYNADLISNSTTTASSTNEDSPYSIIGNFLAPNINNFFVSGLTYAYSIFNGTDYSIVKSTNNSEVVVYKSPIDIWNIQPLAGNLLALNTKPSFSIPGSLYLLNTSSGSLQKILGDINGLTSSVSPDGKFVIYSEGRAESIVTYAYDIDDSLDVSQDFQTLPDKCVWSQKQSGVAYCAIPASIPKNIYPDDWYKGLVSFSDNIYKIDVVSGRRTELFQATEQNFNFDIIDIKLSPDEKYLSFINKEDLTLWVYKIKETN